MAKPNGINIARALLIPQGEMWAAQCLDYDIAASGGSITEAKSNLLALIEDQWVIDVDAGRWKLQGIPPAPPVFFEAWETAHPLGWADSEWCVADKPVDLTGEIAIAEGR